MYYDQVYFVGYCCLFEFGFVIVVVGVFNCELKVVFEGVCQQVVVGWCGGGCSGVDDQYCMYDV